MATAKPQSSGDQPDGDEPMTIWEHLRELRTRLVRSLLGMVPCVVIAWELREHILDFLVAPLAAAWPAMVGFGEPKLNFANPIDPFMAYVKLSLIVGMLLSSPWLAYQAWSFVAPGLYAKEKAYAIPFALASAFFFTGGAYFGYRFVLPVGFEALLGMAGLLPSAVVKVQPVIMINEYLSFATAMLVAFGVVFEVPVVLTFLSATGIVNWKQLLGFSRYWILIAAVLSALLTPSPDVGSMLIMLAPLILLYYVSVGIAYLIGPKVEPEDEAATEAGS
jgi:sec-independent protein translocase protein TatC